MMESHIRVILETSDEEIVKAMKWYLKCEASGDTRAGGIYDQDNPDPAQNYGAPNAPPPALFYYGYFSWKSSSISESDLQISYIINSRKHWPPMQKRIILFDSDKLTRVRLYKSRLYPHERVNGDRKACTLCCISRDDKRSTLTSCSVCKIPLCTTLIGSDTTKTCFQLWHEREDLAAAREEQSSALKSQREESRAAGKYEHARTVRKRQIGGLKVEEKKTEETSMQRVALAAAAGTVMPEEATAGGEDPPKMWV